MNRMLNITAASALLAFSWCANSSGAPGVMASRDYVDRKVAPVAYAVSVLSNSVDYLRAAVAGGGGGGGGGGYSPAPATNLPPVTVVLGNNGETTGEGIPWTEATVYAEMYQGAVIAPSGEWPVGKPVYIRFDTGGVQYSVDAQVVKLGYGEWPSSAFHAVMWKIPNGKCLVNVLYVETE